MTDAALKLLLAMTPERRAKVILELKRRQVVRDDGRPATLKRPKKADTPPPPE